MSAANTVTVACKLPHGLMLEVHGEGVLKGAFDRAKDNPKDGVTALPPGERIHVKGFARPVGVDLSEDAPQVVGGFALTQGVPADFWAKWLAENKDASFVKAGLIFAHEKAGSVIGEAREKKAIRSGFEGMNPDKPGPGLERAPKAG